MPAWLTVRGFERLMRALRGLGRRRKSRPAEEEEEEASANLDVVAQGYPFALIFVHGSQKQGAPLL